MTETNNFDLAIRHLESKGYEELRRNFLFGTATLRKHDDSGNRLTVTVNSGSFGQNLVLELRSAIYYERPIATYLSKTIDLEQYQEVEFEFQQLAKGLR